MIIISLPQGKELCKIIAEKQIPYFLEKRSACLLQTESLNEGVFNLEIIKDKPVRQT